jgi:uncharacterized iron-regulated membrane protein
VSSKKKIFKWHSWLGLFSGLALLLISLSGGVILFHKPINEKLNTQTLLVQPQANPLSYDSLKAIVQSKYPEHDFNGFPDLMHEPNKAVAVSIDQFDKYKTIYINPYNGEILGQPKNELVDWIYRFHYSFQIGKIGEWIAMLISLCLLGSVITGFIIYRKHIVDVLLFRIKISFKNWRVASSALHRVFGVWALLFNFIMAVTGFYLMLYLFVPEDDGVKTQQKNNLTYTFSIDNAVNIAHDTIQNYTINYIKTPRGDRDSTLSLWGNLDGAWHLGDYATNVDFNVFTSEITNITKEKQLDPLTQTQLTLSTLHFGHYGGLIGEIIYLIMALFTSTISITGFLLWWRRKR